MIGDFHYNGHKLLVKFPECAEALDKYRINPGNVGGGKSHDSNFKTMVEVAAKHNRPVRIGVNGGSLDQQLLQRLIHQQDRFVRRGFCQFQILHARAHLSPSVLCPRPPSRPSGSSLRISPRNGSWR